jgi:hypothetical protein
MGARSILRFVRPEIAIFVAACGSRSALGEPGEAGWNDAQFADATALDASDAACVSPDAAFKWSCPQPRTCSCDGGCAFDRGSAADALGAVDLHGCCPGPAKSSHVKIVFEEDGTISSAVVDESPLAGTEAARCIEARFRHACMAPFCGAPVTVGKSFSLP